MLLWSINNALCMYIWIEIAFTIITSAHFKVYHFQEASEKSVWKVNGSPTQSTLYKQCVGSLTSHSILYEQGDGAYRFFYSKKTRKSNRLQMTSGSISRQLFKDPDRLTTDEAKSSFFDPACIT